MLLDVKGLGIEFPTRRGIAKVVRNVSFSVDKGERLGIVGESGCGKSMTLMAILRLVPFPGRITSGSIHLNGVDLLSLSVREMLNVRGKGMSVVLQDPMTALNPAIRIGDQIGECFEAHGIRCNKRQKAIELLESVGVNSPGMRLGQYPHELSGGIQQRVLMAIALSCDPGLLLADEPTTALDVTIQAQIIQLLAEINRIRGTSIVLVTHNLALASNFCQRIMVMYAGKVVESGPAQAIVSSPVHPYTRALIASIPVVGTRRRLQPIEGTVPDPLSVTEGCAFAARCGEKQGQCFERPAEVEVRPDHHVWCGAVC